MALMQIFDPPMCCASGVCGPHIDSTLPRFAADLEWLKGQGVEVQRFNLAQQPRAFAANELVKNALAKDGETCLPLIVMDGEIVAQGVYPPRNELAAWASLLKMAGRNLSAERHAVPVKPVPCCTRGKGKPTGKCC